MEWIAMKSRLLSEIAYNPEREVLHVRLRNNTLKRYDDISPAVFENLRSAESPGFYFNYYIARHHHRSKVRSRAPGVPARAGRLMRLIAVTGAFFVSGGLFIH